MKLKYTVLALVAMTGAASASYTIISTSVDVGGTTYASSSLSGVDLGSFLTTDSLVFQETAGAPVYSAEALNGGDIPAGAANNNNYVHAPNNDGATITILVDGASVSIQTLAQLSPVGPTPDKGVFEWGTLLGVDLIAAAGNAPGVHTLAYEINYTFSEWNGSDHKIGPQTYQPLTGNATFTLVPEPSAAILLGVGALGLLRRRRRK